MCDDLRNGTGTGLLETQKRNLILQDQVYEFILTHPRTTIEDIAEHCNISPQELEPIMTKLLVEGVINFETVKKIKFFYVVDGKYEDDDDDCDENLYY